MRALSFINCKVIKSYSICYMKMEENMAKFFKFVYGVVIFLYLYHVAKKVEGKSLFHPFYI